MKNRNTKRFVSLFVAGLIFLVLPLFANAALPFTVKSGHPRVYLDQARLNTIINASQQMIPLNKTAFPSIGSLVFDINPAPWTDTQSQNSNLGIFDQYDGSRNHFFIRHADQIYSDSGNTACGTPPSQTNLCMQVGLQSTVLPNNYINNYYSVFPLTANQWHTLAISWNSSTHTAFLQIDGGTPIKLGWAQDTSNVPYVWQPSDQQFIFTGRDGLDNIRLYGVDYLSSCSITPCGTTSAPLVNYPMNDVSGSVVTDISGNGHNARISSGVTWETRSSGDTDIRMDGYTGRLTVIANNVLTEAWLDTYSTALALAYDLNNKISVADVSCGSPDYIKYIARVLGLAYLVTNDPQFKSAALTYAGQLIAVTNSTVPNCPNSPNSGPATGGDYTEAGRIEAMGIIYDWLFSDMSTVNPDTGNTYSVDLAAAIKATVKVEEITVCGSSVPLDPTTWTCSGTANPFAVGGHSHQNNTEITAALLAIIGEYHELDNLLNTEYQNFVGLYNPLRAWVSVDGGHHMGWGYGAVYTFLDSIQLWDTAISGVPSMKDAWQGKLIDRYIYGMRGDISFPVSGDGFAGYKPYNDMVAAFALWGSKYYGNTSAQRYYNSWILPSQMGGRLSELLYWEPSLPESSIENLPFSRLFRNAGQVVMRDTWDYLNSTLLEFKSTSFWGENHHHLDQNAFTVFYKAPLLVDSGYYDAYGTPHWYNYFTRTIAHNTLTVFNPNETFSRYGSSYSNDGGQRFMVPTYPTLADIQDGGPNHFDGVTGYEYTPDYTYTVGNASKAYDSTKLDQTNGFIRSMFFLRNPLFWAKPVVIVFDKVTSVPGKENLVKRFLLHTANEPEPLGGTVISPGQFRMTGNTVTVRNGRGMLFAQTLLPENPVITKAGGKDTSGDHRFLVPNNIDGTLTNYPPSPEGPATDTDVGAWRIEVTAPTPTGREYFLHVLSVADNGAVSTPPTAQNLSSANAAVALLANTQTIAFSKSDNPATMLTLSWDSPIAVDNMIVTGLAANAQFKAYQLRNASPSLPYTVVLEKVDTNGALMSSAQGIVTVNTPLPLKMTLTAIKTGSGTITSSPAGIACGTDCTELYNANTSVTLTATANTGSVLGSWTGCASTSGNACTVNMNDNKTITATFISLPDLVVTTISGPSSGTTGSSITISTTTANTGTATAAASTTGLYLASDATITALDTRLGTRSIPSLTAGATNSGSNNVTLPTGLVTGLYYLGAIADDPGLITEGNATGTAESNNAKTGNTIQINGVPKAPSNFSATVNSRSKITLTWTDNATDESGFKIERSTNGTSFSQIATVSANVKTYANSNLNRDTLYYYRVRAYNNRGNSGYSNTVSGRTSP